MKIAIVGCGFVFDIYMRTVRAHPELEVAGVYDRRPERVRAVAEHYGFHGYASYDELLDDPQVDMVVNLTNIGSHYEVSKRALEAGKHVYSEKPITTSVEETRDLFDTAETNGVRLGAAPCNIFSDSVRTMFELVQSGAIGQPLLVYAELDDNPIHLMGFEEVVSPTGAPWPLVEEILEGCTYEHLGYHLIWICGLLGPVTAVTAFSSELIEGKAGDVPGLSGTPDYSVANLHFASGAAARITCSVVAPRDHRMRVIGREGEITTDSYRQYRAPVFLERFTRRSLNARKFQTLRAHRGLGRLLGMGGRRVKLLRNSKSHAVEKNLLVRPSLKQRLVGALRRREVYAQDKFAGIAQMADEISGGNPQYLSPDFLLHLNELTLLVQGAGPGGIAVRTTTTFEPLGPIPDVGALTSGDPRHDQPGGVRNV
ncbi:MULTISPECIES: Gfo/Idh/MocA family oxidoreductase [Aeromicrobium]|jgi:predicted dehydrogenase|uniref:Oxidoreductase n=1 Tax=Aeromicrobium erythreum TaxID=2041 RepID=A0A0U4CL20_9ACTN|nr:MULTISPECIES: Gfo/Idh/MocA family oxidoreductase [Aeromicrobium]ALX06037.1 oxidoreductase [Aeromicrobium erythreum]